MRTFQGCVVLEAIEDSSFISVIRYSDQVNNHTVSVLSNGQYSICNIQWQVALRHRLSPGSRRVQLLAYLTIIFSDKERRVRRRDLSHTRRRSFSTKHSIRTLLNSSFYADFVSQVWPCMGCQDVILFELPYTTNCRNF